MKLWTQNAKTGEIVGHNNATVGGVMNLTPLTVALSLEKKNSPPLTVHIALKWEFVFKLTIKKSINFETTLKW